MELAPRQKRWAITFGLVLSSEFSSSRIHLGTSSINALAFGTQIERIYLSQSQRIPGGGDDSTCLEN